MNEMRFMSPPLTPVNRMILIISAFFLIAQPLGTALFGFSLELWLGLTYPGIMSGGLHRLILYPFLQNGILAFLFNGLVIWFFGSEMEFRWRRGPYLLFLLIAVLAGGLVYIGITALFLSESNIASIPMTGLYGIAGALLIAYGIIFAERPVPFFFIFPIKAKFFCLILVGIELYSAFLSPSGIVNWGHLGAMAAAAIFVWGLTRREHRGITAIKKAKASLHLVKADTPKNKEQDPRFWQ